MPRSPRPTDALGDLVDSPLAAALERAGHVLRTQLRAAGAAHGLSPIQAQLLLRVATEAEAEREPGRLASWFDLSRPTVSDAVAALRRKGLLTHESVPDDRRRTRLALTRSGREMAEQLAGWDGPIRTVLAELPAAAKDDALSLLLELIGRMQQAGLVDVARTCSTCRFYRPPHAQAGPGHCDLLDQPLPPRLLRLDCPDHEPAA